MSDLISRKAAIDAIRASTSKYTGFMEMEMYTDDDAVEAIEALPSAQPKSYREGYQAGFKDAQPEPCKDAVSRNRVKLLLARLRDAVDDGYGFDYQSAVDELRDMPPAQPERMRGTWIIKDNPGTGWYRVTCSECGEYVTSEIPMIGFIPNAKALWDYCPYCGADMRGEADED